MKQHSCLRHISTFSTHIDFTCEGVEVFSPLLYRQERIKLGCHILSGTRPSLESSNPDFLPCWVLPCSLFLWKPCLFYAFIKGITFYPFVQVRKCILPCCVPQSFTNYFIKFTWYIFSLHFCSCHHYIGTVIAQYSSKLSFCFWVLLFLICFEFCLKIVFSKHE